MSGDREKAPLPRGDDQILKIRLLEMVQSGEDPFDVILETAEYLEKKSGEKGYAKIVKDTLRTVYGAALGDKKLLTDELSEVTARKEKIEAASESDELTDEEKARAKFAAAMHEKRIKALKERIENAD